MARPRKKKDTAPEEPPFVLGDDFVPMVSPFAREPKQLISSNSTIGSEGPNKELNLVDEVSQYLLPEWSKNISETLIQQANLKGSPGFDPGFDQAKQVEQMTALGLSVQDIAATLRIEIKLLEKYYKYEIETAAGRINQAVAKIALQTALGGNTDMVKFWLKTRAGWKETKEVQMTGANGGPIQFQEVKAKFLEAIEAEITDVDYDQE